MRVATTGTTFARVIKNERDLIGGPMAGGRIGDYLIGNFKVRFIISDVGHAGGFAMSGGHIIDADLAPGGSDALSEIWAYLDDTFPRQPVYESIEITAQGAGSVAEIVVVGRDSDAPALKVTTRYQLHPDADYLTLSTTIVNEGTATVRTYELGDAVQWGMAEYFGPGVGRALRGTRNLGLPWLAGTAPGVSYGWSGGGARLNGRHGSSWSDPIVRTVTLRPNDERTYIRHLVVGTGDIASLLPSILALNNTAVGIVGGHVLDGSGDPVSRTTVRIDHADGTPYAYAAADSAGRYSVTVPQGIYNVTFSAPGRASLGTQEVGVGTGTILRIDGKLGAASSLRVRATEGGRPIASKLTIVGLGETLSPHFGPAFGSRAARNTMYDLAGRFDVPLSPGKYQVIVSHGPEYNLHKQTVTLVPGSGVEVKARLKREINTEGWLGADFHQHSTFSPDSAAMPRDVLIANACEGVEVVVHTEHDFIADFSGAMRSVGLADTLRSVSGDEITTAKFGHFNAFPLTPQPGKPRNGALDPTGKTPAQIVAELGKLDPKPILQLNHPRSGMGIGYFNLFEFDAETQKAGKNAEAFTLEFDAIEIFNGKRVADAESVMNDWYALLNAGVVLTATGNSDSHSFYGQERGYPRTYIAADVKQPGHLTDSALSRAVRSGQAIVTNGPFVELWAAGQPIGSRIQAGAGEAITVRVRVQAASWVDTDRLEIIRNGKVLETFDLKGNRGSVRFDKNIRVKFDQDSWILAVVRGSEGLEPVVSRDRGESVLPLAVTNPIWIEIKK